MTHPASLTTRLTLLFILVSSSVLLGLAWVLHAAVERHFVEMDRGILQSKVEVLERLLKQPPQAQELTALQSAVVEMFRSDPELRVFVQTADGRVILAPEEPDFPADELPQRASGVRPGLFTWWYDGSRYRGLADAIQPALPGFEPLIVAVAINIDHHERFMERYNRTLFIFIPFAAILSGFLGWRAARRGLVPLRLMQERAASVTASQLNTRLPEGSVPHELTGLAHELNRMLDRLEEAFRRLSNFSSDLAHEMRTPVSNLLTQTQVALSRSRSQREYQEILASSAEELDRLSRMIGDMLFLAKADHGLSLPSVEELRLHEEVADLFEFYDALAEEEGVSLSSAGRAVLRGNRLMLRRAFSNLLSNALRHADEGGYVAVKITEQPSTVSVAVENSGQPLAPEEFSRIFERFYRAEGARTRPQGATGGLGLGLAITRAIIRAHGGDITANSEEGVTCFLVTLPREPSQHAGGESA
ncbi:heavy metal sensor histidine kinase [Guyparkeria hydrothermalis]|uniref:heavy metal sensor histidine kinase n=1 Tax=Guyparkeria hydrothermalis TaxID=923 RepID=UPI00202200AA|nr:heavy metal sensor histidine kinase [Guyparkeria hydrothermalis]MCL7744380.1 heavy metal sensor histidine kinase [Guyparkeria hydrothermalis]